MGGHHPPSAVRREHRPADGQDPAPDTYSPVETIKTRPGSKTMGLDPKTHHLFLPAVEYKAADAGAPKARPTPVPGSFAVLVFGR